MSEEPVMTNGEARLRRQRRGGLAPWEAVRTTLAEVWAHKLRSALTLTGVILGTTAVVVMITMIEAIKVMVWQGFYSLGYDGVMFVSSRPPDDPTEAKKAFFSRGLTVDDIADLEAWGETYSSVAAINVTDTLVRAGGDEVKARVMGVTPSYATVRNRSVSAGRWFMSSDQADHRKVAVLGSQLAETLFGDRDPLGKDIRIGDERFTIVGVERKIGNNFANDGGSGRREMGGVLVPLRSFRAYVRGGQTVGALMIKTDRKEDLDAVSEELTRLVRRSHHGVTDFHVNDVASDMLKAAKRVTELLFNWTVVMATIAGISLLVGGVGIYSVMKISLVERLYEIGLRKAIGATDGAILFQFLVESAMLSAIGGLIGCGLGALLARLFSPFFEAGLPLAPLGLVLGVSFAVTVGIFAGVFPSISAARLTPVEALRG
jgi:putative ABC transport system permease protein